MQISSFQRALLYGAAGVGVVGGGVALLLARNHRKDSTDDAARQAPIELDRFVDAVVDAYDRGTPGDPLLPPAIGANGMAVENVRDGVLALGYEDTYGSGRVLYPEVVGELEWGHLVSGRAFLTEADADGDHAVTRTELRDAIAPLAGADRMLDADERRRVLVDEGLARIVDVEDAPVIVGGTDRDRDVRTAGDVAAAFMERMTDDGDPGTRSIRIEDVPADLPWQRDTEAPTLASGPISSLRPALGDIDDAGNGDGQVSEREVAEWVATRFAQQDTLPGHVRIPGHHLFDALEPQQLGRIDRSTVGGHAYLDPGVPKADVDRYYGGDLAAHIESQPDVREALGSIEWEPDPGT